MPPGKPKSVPPTVSRCGWWPTLIEETHVVIEVPPHGQRPQWLHSGAAPEPVTAGAPASHVADPNQPPAAAQAFQINAVGVASQALQIHTLDDAVAQQRPVQGVWPLRLPHGAVGGQAGSPEIGGLAAAVPGPAARPCAWCC